MSKKDYDQFINKVDQLNKLVYFLKSHPDKYKLFVACNKHIEVVELASKWGFEIGKRWGE